MMGFPHSRGIAARSDDIELSATVNPTRVGSFLTKCDAVREHEFSIALDYG